MDFSIAIELIPKDVMQQQHAWLDVLECSRHGGLVDLEQPDVAARSCLPVGGLSNCRVKAGEKIRTSAVMNRLHARAA